MSLREFMIGSVFMSIALVSAKAFPTGPDDMMAEPIASVEVVEPSRLIAEDKVLGSAYYDTLNILSTANSCSDFFGGSEASMDVFTKFISKVRKDYFSTSIGMRMSGPTTLIINSTTRSQYRLFDRVSLNTNGAFYRRKLSNIDYNVPGVGAFKPNTKEVRVLILLHELGHVMKGADGNWLLPDDGQSEELSRRNSQKIEDVCGEEIKSLGKFKGATNLAEHKQRQESVALASEMLKDIKP